MPSNRGGALDSADYSVIAEFYQRHWCRHYHGWVMTALDRLLLDELPRGARILDLCCGTGRTTQDLCARGFAVTGLDRCEEMLRCARTALPAAEFVAADARSFRLEQPHDAAISTFDSLNHMLAKEDLLRVFERVHAALIERGRFVFDLNTDLAYEREWHRTCSIVEADLACFIRGSYDPAERLGATRITLFRLGSEWRRYDVELRQCCHDRARVLALLRSAGFGRAVAYDAAADLGMTGTLSVGRQFFVADKGAGRARSVDPRRTAPGALGATA